MRSLAFTLLLALLATAACGLVGWRLREGNLNAILGVPATQVDAPLYPALVAEEVRRIEVDGPGDDQEFVKDGITWRSAKPPFDRMDARAAGTIIAFTRGLVVQDSAPMQDIEMEKAGFRENSIRIELKSANGTSLAKYRLGKRAPWQTDNPKTGRPDPTLFVQTRYSGRRDQAYVCTDSTGNILLLFKDNFRFLRDHNPFYFDPRLVQKIRIRSTDGELTIGHENPKDPWRIIKPLDVGTDPAKVTRLLEGLFELRAFRVSDRSAVAPPASAATARTSQIAILPFGATEETVLEIFPAESADARFTRATVSDRPEAIFDLPLKPEPDTLSLADLPLTINELRDPKLANLNIAALKAISIRPLTGPEIILSRVGSQPWTANIAGLSMEANERRVYDLLKAITTGRAIGFESDAATDLSTWGLDHPFLTLRLLGEDNHTITLFFGFDRRGGVFINRLGTPNVMRIDESIVRAISIQPYEWRMARLWSVFRGDVLEIERQARGEPAVALRYDDAFESWKAERSGTDISDFVEPLRARFVLEALEKLEVSRWLPATDEGAAVALANPLLTIAVTTQEVDDQGEKAGLLRRELKIAPAPQQLYPNSVYGRLNTEANYFLLDRETFTKIAIDPIEKP